METLLTALNVSLPSDGAVPDWVELLPAGPQIQGIDGRAWLNDQPEQVLAWLRARNRPIVIDWEHASELKAPKGDEAPAAAWIADLELRDGVLMGRAEWTERARQQIQSREYRYLSPVLIYDKRTSRIVGISSAALTNQPNLNLRALNRESPTGIDQETPPMSIPKQILDALGLAATADETAAVAAINQLQGVLQTARNRAESPSLDKFVPRADYDAALARATNAEQKLQERQQAELEAEIDREIQSALEAGKITPPSVDYYKAACRMDGGLERFREHVKALPAIPGVKSPLDGKKPPAAEQTVLTEEDRALCRQLSLSESDYAKALKETA